MTCCGCWRHRANVATKDGAFCWACFWEWRANSQPLKRAVKYGPLCKRCKQDVVYASTLCRACYAYRNRTGNDRPRKLIRRNLSFTCRAVDEEIVGE